MKYSVIISITSKREKELTIYARDVDEAEAKACEIVEK